MTGQRFGAMLGLLTVLSVCIAVVKSQGPSGPCISTGSLCVNDCSEVPNFQDGNYQWCESCHWFVQCANRNTYYQPCPSNQIWHDYFKDCLPSSTTCQECAIFKPPSTGEPTTTTPLPVDRTCSTTGDICIETCEREFDGTYQWCGSCNYFLQCRGNANYFTQCQPGLSYDHDQQFCDYVSGTCFCQSNTLPPSSCEIDPCQNGGLCNDDGSGESICQCPPDFTGPHCELPVSPDIRKKNHLPIDP